MDINNIITEVRDTAEEFGLYFREDYSGRGMFGATCVAVDYDSDQEFLDFWVALDPAVREALGHRSTDSMGLGTVAYWRGAQTKEGRF